MTIDVAERRARLALRHRLLASERTDDLAAIADAVVALHSSDPVSVYLSAAVRMVSPSLGAVEHALYDDRSLIRHHAMRRTLWVTTPATVRVLHAAATRGLVAADRRRTAGFLAASGVSDPDAWLDDAFAQTVADLRAHGPSTAREVGARIPALRHPLQVAAGTPFAATQSAHTRVLLHLGFSGEILRARPAGTWLNGAYRYAATASWLAGGLGELDPAVAAATLTDSYLRRFGPVTTADARWWTGWTVARTRQALVDCGAVAVELEGGSGWVAAGDEDLVGPVEEWIAVLPGLDPTTMAGSSAGGTSPRRPPTPSTATATRVRRSGSTDGWSAPGPSTAAGSCGRTGSRGWPPTVGPRWPSGWRRSVPSSETPASVSASPAASSPRS